MILTAFSGRTPQLFRCRDNKKHNPNKLIRAFRSLAGVAIVEHEPHQQQRRLADESYDDDEYYDDTTPSLSLQSACSSGAYHQVYGCYGDGDDDDDEVMRIEIDESDVIASCASDYDDEVVVVHRERCDSSSSDELSLPSTLMGGYELTSMSMYDVTHTSPVTGDHLLRHHHHHHHASMPDMNEASHVIPDIDVILHSSSSSSSSVTSSALASQYSVG